MVIGEFCYLLTDPILLFSCVSHFRSNEKHSLYLLSYYGMYFNHVQNTETVKIMSSTKQEHDDLQRAKYQLETELENLRREKSNVVRPASDIVLC